MKSDAPSPAFPYSGSFTVELQPNTTTTNVPTDKVHIRASKFSVANGKVNKVNRTFEFTVHGDTFGWASDYIRQIKDDNGKILWLHPSISKEREELARSLVQKKVVIKNEPMSYASFLRTRTDANFRKMTT